MPTNDPATPSGHRMVAGELPGGRFAPPSTPPDARSRQRNSDWGVRPEGAQNWPDAVHTYLDSDDPRTRGTARRYWKSLAPSLDQYYLGLGPELAAAHALLFNGSKAVRKTQRPRTSDGARYSGRAFRMYPDWAYSKNEDYF